MTDAASIRDRLLALVAEDGRVRSGVGTVGRLDRLNRLDGASEACPILPLPLPN